MRFPVRDTYKYVNKCRSSKEIRKQFLDYFINYHGHSFVRSSPVIPFCDPTVAFVNAGMNQFKGILLGNQAAAHKRVTNYQKCVRVGGKHNDMNVVGADGYHHTFFEMLGNWSFGDYFKKEACTMAWHLLTNVYHIPPRQLYVTYFKGDEGMGLEEDSETREIWKSLGVPENRILPFDLKDNFWEMGPTGPCGPSTEIHVDHMGPNNRAVFVNKGLHDLTELWNIVFIEYNRNPNGSLTSLPNKHVDTGLGFERLTALLQGKISNYDTDNFSYLINAIQKICRGTPKYRGTFGERDWNSLDAGYRVLSDHSRMITACLADGMIPEQNQKLRRLLRKALLLCEGTFKKDSGLLQDLSRYVVEHLGQFYPEMEKNIDQILQMLNYEEEVWREVRMAAEPEWKRITAERPRLASIDALETPHVIAAYRELRRCGAQRIDAKLAFRLYDTHGVDGPMLRKLAEALDLPWEDDDVGEEMVRARRRSREAGAAASEEDPVAEALRAQGVPTPTDDRFRYECARTAEGRYDFSELPVRVLKTVREDGRLSDDLEAGEPCDVLLDHTCLYAEAGGQVADGGELHLAEGAVFHVDEVVRLGGYLLHRGILHGGRAPRMRLPTQGALRVRAGARVRAMRNHTAVHLLNRALKLVKGATCQKSSRVTDLHCNLDVAVFGPKMDVGEIARVEDIVRGVVAARLPVSIRHVDSQELLRLDDVVLVPGEVYPDSHIRLIEVVTDEFVSREPCCGTHVLNTSDIEDFCLVGFKSLGRSTTSLHGVTGDRAQLARKNGIQIADDVACLQKSVDDNIDKPEVLEKAVNILKARLKFDLDSDSILPVVVKQQCSQRLNNISKQIKDTAKSNLREFIDIEMKNVLESGISVTRNNKKYVLHYLRSSMLLESAPLQKATGLCPDLPILIIAFSDNTVKARCCVPKEVANENFTAEKWLKQTVAATFKSAASPPKGQDGNVVCNMKPRKVSTQDWDMLLNDSLEAAKNYIEENL